MIDMDMTFFSPLRVGPNVFIDDNIFYRWRGDTAYRDDTTVDVLESFDLVSDEWKSHPTSPFVQNNQNMPKSVTGSGIALVNKKLYLFGGFASTNSSDDPNPKYYRDLFVLDLESFVWQKLVPVNDNEGPMLKYISGVAPLGSNTIIIFGGFGLKHDSIPLQPWSQYDWSEEFSAMWTNELHLYNFLTNEWINPKIEGIKPSPCAAFCFTMIDQSRFILFGGRQKKTRVNEIQIFDTNGWAWSGPILPIADQLWPEARSLHTGVSLLDPELINISSSQPEQRLLVMWGQDHSSDPLDGAWIYKVNSQQWEKLDLSMRGRKWHSTAVTYPSSSESTVITVGGFQKEQSSWTCPHHNDTVIMKFGIPSLYNLCIQYLCDFISPEALDTITSQCLPKRVADKIQDITTQQADFTSLYRPYSRFDFVAKVCEAS